MFAYYLNLGLRSLRRNPALSALMVLAIGFGVAASMTTYAVFRAVSGNPIPNKSSQLFKPQVDNWGHANGRTSNDPPDAMGYTDAVALLRDHKAEKQAVMYPVGLSLVPDNPQAKPFLAYGYATTSDYFSMFEVPFQYGAGWPASDDTGHASAAVITAKINQRLFGGQNSVGKSITLNGRSYRITGVAKAWNPQPRYYDVVNGSGFGSAPQVWIPFSRAIELQTATAGNNNRNGAVTRSGWDAWLHSECVWLSYWAQLPDASAAATYKRYLHGYAEQQCEVGRFAGAAGRRDEDGVMRAGNRELSMGNGLEQKPGLGTRHLQGCRRLVRLPPRGLRTPPRVRRSLPCRRWIQRFTAGLTPSLLIACRAGSYIGN